MLIGGLQKSSLIDFPEKISAIIFTQGCNFRCGYCHNPELLGYREPQYEFEDVLKFLETRKGKLDGVVITGGEATLQNDLKESIQKIKNMGFEIKLDTNGTNPVMLQDLIENNLLNYVAMDIKAPFDKYFKIVNLPSEVEQVKRSVEILMNSNIKYEFRTTVLKTLLSEEDLFEIGRSIKGAKKYYLQKFVPTKAFDENLLEEKNYSDEEFEKIAEVLRKDIEFVGIR